MTTLEPGMAFIGKVGRLAWTGLWWLIAVGGCSILIAACIATLPY
jgi:hypothetical protein